jgi:hypothetical protein
MAIDPTQPQQPNSPLVMPGPVAPQPVTTTITLPPAVQGGGISIPSVFTPPVPIPVTTTTTQTVTATENPVQLAETAALTGKSAGVFVWILVYLVVLAVGVLGGYLIYQAVSMHNVQATTWVAGIAAFATALFVPSPAATLLKR